MLILRDYLTGRSRLRVNLVPVAVICTLDSCSLPTTEFPKASDR